MLEGVLKAEGDFSVSQTDRNSTEKPPLNFDLTSLQREANNMWSWSAKRTLSVAQELYAEQLKDVSMVVMLASMLHSIGVGNMLPAWVRVVCVDINPAVVTKLADRGSSQTAGIVTDVGLFLQQLSRRLGEHDPVSRINDGAVR